MRGTTKDTVTKARKLRRALTPPEVALWALLRRKPANLKFRRQHPIGPYILDFYCPAAKLGIEIDGIAHGMGNNPDRDERRDGWLGEQGIAVLRIPAAVVLSDVEAAFQYILARGAEGPSTTA